MSSAYICIFCVASAVELHVTCYTKVNVGVLCGVRSTTLRDGINVCSLGVCAICWYNVVPCVLEEGFCGGVL